MAAASEGAKFTVIPLRVSPGSTVCRQLFVKQHRVRDPDPQRPQDRTLFVLNLPPYINQECVHRLFSQCGTVTSVELQEKPGPSTKSKAQKSKFFSRPLAQGFQVAYVVFKSSAAVKHAVSLKAQEPWVLTTAQHLLRTGVQKWAEDYCSSITDPRELQDHIDQFMEQHDQDQAELQAMAEAEEGVPDEDGWVKVTRRGRHPGIPRTEAANLRLVQREKQKRAQRELLNFYSWQHREAKREHIAQLRRKFEEDKQKIALMRAQRKFKPY
ncbi:ribosomal RNA-processing protein 7 homolog A isoform X1 [Stegostoma tigrinum]|uniref:ribosomal RNA-processing protein 7 homolog A isoform X1 n=1 Tax=Stegostoma tigrinum TaxID=3053191 RepID=UPI00286FE65A|nr:ribosomal RNA-processing protein 7 homolog A isoform X1 [Stegostoma tigrinum]